MTGLLPLAVHPSWPRVTAGVEQFCSPPPVLMTFRRYWWRFTGIDDVSVWMKYSLAGTSDKHTGKQTNHRVIIGNKFPYFKLVSNTIFKENFETFTTSWIRGKFKFRQKIIFMATIRFWMVGLILGICTMSKQLKCSSVVCLQLVQCTELNVINNANND